MWSSGVPVITSIAQGPVHQCALIYAFALGVLFIEDNKVVREVSAPDLYYFPVVRYIPRL